MSKGTDIVEENMDTLEASSVVERERRQFEAWISSPPYEKGVSRWPSDAIHGKFYGWPGQYRDIDVQLAWEAWSERCVIARQRWLNRRTHEALDNHGNIE